MKRPLLAALSLCVSAAGAADSAMSNFVADGIKPWYYNNHVIDNAHGRLFRLSVNVTAVGDGATTLSLWIGHDNATLAKVEELLEKEHPGCVGHSISVTTRAPRGQEQDGVEYYFRTTEQFEQMIKDGKIVEYDKYVDNYYGTPSDPLDEMLSKGQDVLFDITIEGSLALNRKFDVDTVTIFILPPSMEELESRLRGRGTETEEKIAKRLAQSKEEIKRAGEFEYIITNDDVDRAARDILAIITAEKLKASKNIRTAKELE